MLSQGWDFRLPLVRSINASGHEYGLVYLGGDMPTFTLNFSRAGNQVVGQYYNFLRLGRAGYTQVMERLRLEGWQVPAYTMPEGAEDVAVLRVVVREGFSRDLADALLGDLRQAVAFLEKNPPPARPRAKAFAH